MERPRCVLVACTLDDVGIRTQRADQQGTHTYSYDDLYRLTSVTYPGPSTTSYAFDAFGNRTSMTVAGNTTTYAYDENDRIASVTPPARPRSSTTPGTTTVTSRHAAAIRLELS